MFGSSSIVRGSSGAIGGSGGEVLSSTGMAFDSITTLFASSIAGVSSFASAGVSWSGLFCCVKISIIDRKEDGGQLEERKASLAERAEIS